MRPWVYPKGTITVRKPDYKHGHLILHEIDLMALKDSEILLVQCKQAKVKNKEAEKIEKELQMAGGDLPSRYNLPTGIIVKKWITYTDMSKNAEQFLHGRGVVLKSAKEMLCTLISLLPELEPRPEPMLWLLQTLDHNGLLRQDYLP